MIVYKITNIETKMMYIGITTTSLKLRFRRHIEATYDQSKTSYMCNAIRKYGKDKFIIDEIDSASTIEELSNKEQFYIEKYNTLYPNGYNILKGGFNSYNLTEEHKLKMSCPIKAVSIFDGNEYYFISFNSLPSGFNQGIVYYRVDSELQYKGYKWYKISKEEYLNSNKNTDITEYPYIVAIKDNDTIFIKKGKLRDYGFNPINVCRILKKQIGRKTHLGYKFMYYIDYLKNIEGMETITG